MAVVTTLKCIARLLNRAATSAERAPPPWQERGAARTGEDNWVAERRRPYPESLEFERFLNLECCGGLPGRRRSPTSTFGKPKAGPFRLVLFAFRKRKDKVFKGFTEANALGGSQRHHVRPGHAVTALSNDLRLGVFKKAFALSVLRPCSLKTKRGFGKCKVYDSYWFKSVRFFFFFFIFNDAISQYIVAIRKLSLVRFLEK